MYSRSGLRLVAPRRFEVVDYDPIDERTLDPGNIVVRRQMGTICGTDIPNWNGTENSSFPGHTGFPLHECVGIVTASTSNGFAPGQRVVAIPYADAGLATHFVAPATSATEVSPLLSDAVACVVQPLSTVLYALDRLGHIGDRHVLILGFGSIGRLFSLLLRVRDCPSIAVVDAVDRGDYRSWGADQFIQANVAEMHAERAGADVVVDAVGHATESVQAAVRLVRPGGTILVFGLPQPGARFDLHDAFYRKLTIIGSVNPPWQQYLATAGKLATALQPSLAPLVTHTFDMGNASEAFELHESAVHERIKVAIRA